MEPRYDLIAHVREQIAQDPEGYANAAKLGVVADRLVELLGEATEATDEDGG